ncbi:MAG: DUF58 domain-containing protein, partial [bacterium]|nr:DUF58 domain-containing protein [bacterium]
LLAAIIDYRQGVKSNSLSFTPGGSTFFSIGKKNHITFTIRNKGDRPLNIEVKTDLPHSWEALAESSALSIGPHGKSELIVEYRPLRRGVYCLKYIHYRYSSPSGLVFIHRKEKINLEIEVFPDVKEVNRYLMMSRRNKLYELGIHRNRFQGMGTNLEFLRDYQMDDDSKRIDWKASTRNNKLVTKVFQMESNNLIAIVLDCGRMMTAERKGLNALDYAINAALILSYVAQKMGDSVTIIAFSDKIEGELPPVKGKNMMSKILRFLTKLQPSFVESNYQQAFNHIEVRLKRRAMIILFSDLIDDINYTLFYKYLSVLKRKHLPLIILLRDILLMENADLPPKKLEDAYISAAAADMYMRRADVIKKFKQKRINLLDLLPQEVTPALIDKYLELKSRNMI